MSLTNFKVALLMLEKQSDWSKVVMGLGTANQSALFQQTIRDAIAELELKDLSSTSIGYTCYSKNLLMT